MLAYAPCTVHGRDLKLQVDTHYPFAETIVIRILQAPTEPRRVALRIPAWCNAPMLRLAGKAVPIDTQDGVVSLLQTWHPGAEITLHLPMPVRVEGRTNGAISLHSGPITLAYCPGEIWRGIPDTLGLGDWEVTPRSSWNFGLDVEADAVDVPWVVERRAPSPLPFSLAAAPVRVSTRGRFIPEWTLHHNSAAPAKPGHDEPDAPADCAGALRLRAPAGVRVPAPRSRGVHRRGV